MELTNNLEIRLKERILTLQTGFYIYVGSAFGAGGLSSRIHRHLRRSKKQHWHIDQVTCTENCTFYGVVIFPNEKSECLISRKLEKFKELIPIIGFGNSDCKKSCLSHFYKIDL
ncbi:MAG: GIY-YIG nuclease family protein [Asgard group archaeon]|nr:GIY-YIG nuclease family protein [Asgard group archaeon]